MALNIYTHCILHTSFLIRRDSFVLCCARWSSVIRPIVTITFFTNNENWIHRVLTSWRARHFCRCYLRFGHSFTLPHVESSGASTSCIRLPVGKIYIRPNQVECFKSNKSIISARSGWINFHFEKFQNSANHLSVGKCKRLIKLNNNKLTLAIFGHRLRFIFFTLLLSLSLHLARSMHVLILILPPFRLFSMMAMTMSTTTTTMMMINNVYLLTVFLLLFPYAFTDLLLCKHTAHTQVTHKMRCTGTHVSVSQRDWANVHVTCVPCSLWNSTLRAKHQ